MIHIVAQPATDEQIQDMLEVHEDFIKVAVDIRRRLLAGGGEFHADCESALVETGSLKEDIWGADWVPAQRTVRFSALINIRPRTNRGMEIIDSAIRQKVEQVILELLRRS